MSSVTRLLAAATVTALTFGLAGAAHAAGRPGGDPVPSPPLVAGPVIGGPALGRTGLVVDVPRAVPTPPAVRAHSYLVADAGTGAVLAAKNPHVAYRPASTLKLLMALVVMPRLDPATEHTATFTEASIEGSRVGIVPGATYTVADLWYGLFLNSANDAATALADANGGVAPTVEQMRQEARSLGANDTTVVNPTGLDADGQYSSAYDLALFGRAALGIPGLTRYTTTTSFAFPGRMPAPGRTRSTFMIYTEQRFVLHDPYGIGLKNGYTSLANSTLITAATRDGHTVLVSLMDDGPWVWKDAIALTGWAFAHGSQVTPVGDLVEPANHRLAQAALTTVDPARWSTSGALPRSAAAGWAAWPVAGAGGALLLLAVGALRVRALRRRSRYRSAAQRRRPPAVRRPATPRRDPMSRR
ncbi:MAG: D-alanyl-D-alanine carboxypeptidase family protein [Actinomycetes bacterium]